MDEELTERLVAIHYDSRKVFIMNGVDDHALVRAVFYLYLLCDHMGKPTTQLILDDNRRLRFRLEPPMRYLPQRSGQDPSQHKEKTR